MSLRGRSLLVFLLAVGGCSGDPGAPLPQAATGQPQPSEVVFQAVDAGTGGALTDAQVTVRYLVRSPITEDAVAAEAVPSAEPYTIVHEISADSLVVEVRLEAPSYHRLDTTLAVARGASAGPLTVRMSRRLDRAAQAPGGDAAGDRRPVSTTPASQPAPVSGSGGGVARSALQEGDAAFRAGNWFEAAASYARMPVPTGTGAAARAYQRGMVNAGISHINLGEMGAAMDALETAIAVGPPNHHAYRHLGHVLCEVGRVDDGLDALDELEDMADDIDDAERPLALAFGKYEEGLCRKRTFDRTEGTLNLVSAGRSVVSAFDEFIERGEDVESPTPELTTALADANRLLEEIRIRMRRGGQ